MEPRPIGRARAFATMHAEARWATGGQPAIDGGTDAPYFTCLTLAGRPSDQHEHLLEGMTALIVKHLKVDRLVVRGRIIPVDPAHWAIGGSGASTARKAEIDGRRSVCAPGRCDRDRSEARRVGKERVSPGRSRWTPAD